MGGGGVIVLDIATARNVFLSSLKAMCNSASVRCLLGAYVVLVMVVRKLMRDAPELQQCQAAELGVSVGMQRLLVIVVSEREREKERARARERERARARARESARAREQERERESEREREGE